MKEFFKNIGRAILGISLICLALFLIFLLIIPALIWKIFVSITSEDRKARDIISGTAEFFEAIAISIDVFGGVAYSGMFNSLLLKEQKYPFGSPYETISEVLGWAQHYNDLTPTGKLLVKILDKIDKDHCEKTRVYGLVLASHKLALRHKKL